MQQALVELAGIGSGIGAPAILFVLGEALRKVGRHDEALGTLGLGLAQAEQQAQHYVDADLHRLRADILIEDCRLQIADFPSPNPQSAILNLQSEAEALLGQALEIGRRQEAKLFELRAATSMARLWQRQGKRDAARALLLPVYEWFTEGFETRDLIEAKALLEQLG
jgi:predicted ATPase